MESKINIILVTGFLGSGKTTLLNHLIHRYRSKKLGLIINDFGEIAVDGQLLRETIRESKTEGAIHEISNGSIFCSCLSYELVKSLEAYRKIEPDYLIIETSGLSDPSVFGKILEENRLDAFFQIKAAVCIVDPVKTLQLASRITAIDKQISSSGIIVINKKDIVSESDFLRAVAFAKERNGKAIIIETSFAAFDFSILENIVFVDDNQAATSCNTVKARPGSIVLPQKEVTKAELNAFYENVKEDIYRIKGFLKIGKISYYIADDDNKLLITATKSPANQYGLSVLLPVENIERTKNYWIQ